MVPGAVARHERPCIGQRKVAGQAWVTLLSSSCMQAIGAKPGAASPSVDAILPNQVFSLRSAHDAMNGAFASLASTMARGRASRA